MKKILFFLPFLITTAPIFTVSCSQTNNFYLAQKEVKTFLKNLEFNKMDFKNWQNKTAIKEMKYLKYLLDSSNEEKKYSLDYFSDRLELKVNVPFLKNANQKGDITKDSLGRMMKIAHADHFHIRFVSWDELPPTKEEKANGIKKGYTYVFNNVKHNGKLDWSKVIIKNDFLRNDNFPKIVNLDKDSKKIKPQLKKGAVFSKFKFKVDTDLKTFLKTLLSKEDIKQLENKEYKDAIDKDYSWRYNAHHENLLLSDAALALGVDLINMLAKSNKVKNFGFDEVNMNLDLFNYWLVNKPSAHAKDSYDSGEIIKDKDFLDLNEIQLSKLQKINQGNVEFENFLRSLEKKDRDIFKENIDKYRSVLPKVTNKERNMKLFYIVQNGEKRYVNNIFTIIKFLYGNLIKVKSQFATGKIYYNLLPKDAREIDTQTILKNDSDSPLGFSLNLENMIDWNSNSKNLYYLSSNDKVFKTENDLQNWINN